MAFAVVCMLFDARPMRAQFYGIVVDSAGATIPDAQVELWSSSSRLAVGRSDELGRFTVPAGARLGATALLARRLGFAPVRVPLNSNTDSTTVIMRALAATLPEVTVIAATRLCPNHDEPSARVLWNRSRRTYLSGAGYARGANFTLSRDVVAGDKLGSVIDSGTGPGYEMYSSAGDSGIRASIALHGYVSSAPPVHWFEDFGAWVYPPLAGAYAEHFADSLFGARHTLSLLPARDGETTLGFCPRNRRLSGLEGTLRIASDGSFLEARWQFWNPARGAEEAGGEVLFAPRNSLQPIGILVPSSGLFWRRLRTGRYYQVRRDYLRWQFGTGGIVH